MMCETSVIIMIIISNMYSIQKNKIENDDDMKLHLI
jgi:hypothetical protein